MKVSYWKFLGSIFKPVPGYIKSWFWGIDWIVVEVVMGCILAMGGPIACITIWNPLPLLSWIPSFFLFTHAYWRNEYDFGNEK